MANSLLVLVVMTMLGLWFSSIRIESVWQQTGLTTFSLGFTLLLAYASAQVVSVVRLPLISGCIFAGIIAGPFITGFLGQGMVERLRLVDDLALSFIALGAGGHLHLQDLRSRGRAIALNIGLLTVVVFGAVFGFIVLTAQNFLFLRVLTWTQIIAFASLIAVIAVARSPSSAIAIISECRATGLFTETVLGVTVAMDVIIIILFSLVMTCIKTMLPANGTGDFLTLIAIFLETMTSLGVGLVLGKGISLYIRKVGHDLPLFLLFFAFGIAKGSLWLDHFMETQFGVSLHLEPLLVCMSAGFVVQNLSGEGLSFMNSLERISLPIYVLFFSLAGASLDLVALKMTWPFAASLVLVRSTAIFGATWTAGALNRDPPRINRIAWMAYVTQAGVAIGLAQLAERHFPDIGVYLTTVVLAVIAINQVVGPITFKMVLNMVGESRYPKTSA